MGHHEMKCEECGNPIAQAARGRRRCTWGGACRKTVHVHHHATYNVQAFDSTGVDTVLEQHSQKFSDHVTRELRKRNM
jgi:hypothetical protein